MEQMELGTAHQVPRHRSAAASVLTMIAGAFARAVGSSVCYGLRRWLLATRLGARDGKGTLLTLGGFAFAWCVGFIVVFAPAGGGVRDVLPAAILGPVIGSGAATAATLVSRVAMTGGDLITALAAAGVGRYRSGVS